MRKGQRVCSWDRSPLVLNSLTGAGDFCVCDLRKNSTNLLLLLLLLLIASTEGCSEQNCISSAFHGLVAVHFVTPLMIAALDQ
jgi:hypothetical protein